MKTAKALGFVKGDFVFTGYFPGIIVQHVNTTTPMVEVWGTAHEIGSCYAHNLRKLAPVDFLGMVDLKANPPYTDAAKKSIAALEAW